MILVVKVVGGIQLNTSSSVGQDAFMKCHWILKFKSMAPLVQLLKEAEA